MEKLNIMMERGDFDLVAVGRAPMTKNLSPATPAPASGIGESLWPVTLTIALSGMTALNAEVVWTRLLGMMFAGTVYAFAIILAVFLIGMSRETAKFASLTQRPASLVAKTPLILLNLWERNSTRYLI